MVLILMIVDKRCGFYQLPFDGEIDISAICGRKNKLLRPDFFRQISNPSEKWRNFLKNTLSVIIIAVFLRTVSDFTCFYFLLGDPIICLDTVLARKLVPVFIIGRFF